MWVGYSDADHANFQSIWSAINIATVWETISWCASFDLLPQKRSRISMVCDQHIMTINGRVDCTHLRGWFKLKLEPKSHLNLHHSTTAILRDQLLQKFKWLYAVSRTARQQATSASHWNRSSPTLRRSVCGWFASSREYGSQKLFLHTGVRRFWSIFFKIGDKRIC